MSASQLTYTKFAVAGGTGGLGAFIVKELVAQGASVVVLSRSAEAASAGATVVAVDYADPSGLVKALAGIEVVISTLSHGGFALQHPLADAAKAAGVKLFVPGEFGTDAEPLSEDSLIYFKKKVQLHLQSLNLPYTLYHNGWFSDLNFIPQLGFDIPGKTISIVGSGSAKVSFTARPDIARFVAYTLTHLPEDRLKNASLRVEGEKTTLRQLKPIFEQVFGGEFTIKTREVADVEKLVTEKGMAAFGDFLLLLTERGQIDLGANDNALVPEFNPLGVADVVKKYYT